MALNLSTLTSPATSGDVLAEALTTADFLEGVPVLRNLARGSQKGGDAKQDVALNQPKALPLDANGKGYCYLPVTTGNAPAVTFPTIGSSDDFVLEMDVFLVDVSSLHLVSGSSTLERIIIYNSGYSFQCNVGGVQYNGALNLLTEGASKITVERTSGTVTLKQNGVTKGTLSNVIGSATFSHLSWNGQYTTGVLPLNGYIQKATLSIGGTEQLNIDFTATNMRHGDTKFKCATGQVVTINQSGNDPATIIKKPVLRFDGANSSFQGLFNQTITDGYMFAAFSVLGGGGEAYGRVFSVNSTANDDSSGNGAIFSIRGSSSSQLRNIFNGAFKHTHISLFDDANGDILHQSLISSGNQLTRVNNADESSSTEATTISAEEFNIATRPDGTANTAIDLEFLALFSADSVPDEATASKIRNYINNRNTVFLRHDTDGYYFYDAQKAPVGNISSGSASWNGRIIGSDFGDTDRYLTQGTSDDQPVGDGFKVTFADNTDHLEITNPNQAGWQVVGTSRGTFAYRVNNTAVTELNLLGNLGQTEYRKAGDLYGIILLPESATGADIESARSLLIDRGAADGTTSGTIFTNWYNRDDIVEFKHINTSSVTYASYAWYSCQALEKFPALDLSNSTTLSNAWLGCTVLSDFGAIQADSCTDFASAWKSCTSLASFPAGAKLGTEATGVNFRDAWRSSGLTSFSTPLPTANSVREAWRACTSLTSFSTELPSATNTYRTWYGCSSLSDFKTTNIKNCSDFTGAWQGTTALQSFPSGAQLGTEAASVNFESAWRSSGLTSFSTPLPTAIKCTEAWKLTPITSFNLTSLPQVEQLYGSFEVCTQLTSFSTAILKSKRMLYCWRSCSSLTDFSAEVFANWNPSVINDRCFDQTWSGCTSLTAQSVENILTSIDASGKYGTATGAAGGGSIDSGIDIDYDGTALSAATNAAIRSLDTKGWEVYINGEIRTGVELLDLQGFYFFESEGLAAANVTSWDSSIGASSASLDLVGAQADGNDQPVADGTVVTFADNSDHIDITSTPQAGWQVVGTSLGTFAYRVNNTAVTELNLLGNAGVIRTAGDSYGMILLPESATGADIEAARKLLIDRGAADGTTSSAASNDWYGRSDIVEFKHINTSSLTALVSSFRDCINLENFPALDLSNSNNFSSAWQNCSALTSFPAGAKLGTEANNVNFTAAWKASGLTSFSTPVPTANICSETWRDCDDLVSFDLEEIPLATNTYACWFADSSLISFSTALPSTGYSRYAFTNCTSLTDFSADVFSNWNPSVISSLVFDSAWDGCTALTADSVGNILRGIDASNQFATVDGNSGSSAIADAGIDIDYNTATGSLSAATNAAIDSLSGKGWEVFINGVLVIPNILDLAPAAAYSLRSFDADADPNVVNVRRSSDSALRDFTASEVSDGTLTTWVNTEYETVINGEFTTDSDWSKGSGWDIANGKATSDGTQTGVSFLNQASNMGASQSQRVTLVVSDYTAGTVRVRLGVSAPNSSITSQVSSNGTHVFTLPSHSNPSVLFIEASADFQGSIESISVVQLTADGHVTTWYDQSIGGTSHATQTVASSQPKLVDAGTLVTEGGLAALDFGADADELSLVSSSYDAASIFAVTKPNTSSGNPLLGVSGSKYIDVEADTLAYRVTNFDDIPFTNDFTQQLAVVIREDGTGAQPVHGYRNGVVSTEDPCDTNQELLTGSMSIGRRATSDYYDGTIQEIVIYDSDQSANRTGIETNINDHFDIYS